MLPAATDKKEKMTVSQKSNISGTSSDVLERKKLQMNLLFVSAGFQTDPDELAHINLVKDFLREKGWRVDTFMTNLTAVSSSATQFTNGGRLPGLANVIGSVKKLMRIIRQYDIVHFVFLSHMSFIRQMAPALLLTRFFGKKIMLSYCRNQAEDDLERSGRWLCPFLRLCDTILVSSTYLADLFSRYKVMVDIIPDCVDTGLFKPRDIVAVQPKLIVVRSLEKRNNLACAIKGFKLVKQKYPRAEMLIVGDGSQRQELEKLVVKEKISGVMFTGRVSRREFAHYLTEADVYVNTSTIDGLPTSLLEALTVGLPVVSTGVGGIPDVVQKRVNGLIIRPNDPAGLADRINELVESPELVRKLSELAKSSVKDYTWPKVQQKWVDVYHCL